jgi:hypothetical protein
MTHFEMISVKMVAYNLYLFTKNIYVNFKGLEVQLLIVLRKNRKREGFKPSETVSIGTQNE